MKYFIFSTALIVCTYSLTLAQTLPDPTFSYVPCYGIVGYTDSVVVNPVPGATGYIWETNPGQINGLLLNGNISPNQTTLQSTNITYTLAQQYWVVCVTAFSSCCTSAQVCDTISGINGIQFNSANSPIAFPNSTGTYGINFECSSLGGNTVVYWTITGDVTFSNGTQTFSGANALNVPLTFGPGFTTGVLCVYTANNFGQISDTLCMTINAPVGIEEANSESFNFYVENQNNQLVLELPASKVKRSITIYDSAGRFIFILNVERQLSSSKNQIDLSTFSEGLYIIKLSEKDKITTAKFVYNR